MGNKEYVHEEGGVKRKLRVLQTKTLDTCSMDSPSRVVPRGNMMSELCIDNVG